MKILASILWSFLALTIVTVPLATQDKNQKQYQKQSQKNSKKNSKHSDQNSSHSKPIKSAKMIVGQQPPYQATTTKQVPFAPFSKNRITVVKQRNVRMLQTLPDGYSSTIFGGRNFYHYGGRYYGYSGNMYSMVAAPIGIQMRLLPAGHRRIFIGGAPHFYYAGVYYREIGENQYEVVKPTIGTIVPELPDENVEEVMLDGQVLYEYDNILYKSVVTKTGVQYEVVGKLGD
jgi:hypothetical protein